MGAILDAALEYAEAGYAVIPVRRSDKSPYTANGLTAATTNPAAIRQWWEWWPEANVAIVCGRVSGNLFAIDIDIKPEKGKHGDEELLKWQAEHGDFPNTVTQRTGSGGLHKFFRHPDIALYKNVVDAIPGVDIRGDGAYVVVAPSVYEDGRIYEWEGPSLLDTIEVADANTSVIELLELNKKGAALKQQDTDKPFTVKNAKSGNRNQTIFRFASGDCGRGVPYDICLDEARKINERYCDPPLDDSEVVKTVQSAYKYEPDAVTIFGDAGTVDENGEFLPKLPEELTMQFLLNPPPKKPPIIWDYLREGEALLLSGNPKAGKSFLIVQLALAVATGGKWIGQKCNQKTVLYIDAELSPEMTAERIKTIREKMGVSYFPEDLHVINTKKDKVTLKDVADDFEHGLRHEEVVIIDPLYMFLSSDENDNSQMKKEMEQLKRISATGTAVVVVHHMSKGIQSGKLSIDRASGAGVLGRFFDSILTLNLLNREATDKQRPERVEADTRSFQQPMPVNLWFDGFHVVDTSGELAGRDLNDPKKSTLEQKTANDTARLNHCYLKMKDNCTLRDDGGFTLEDMIAMYETCWNKTMNRTTLDGQLARAGYIKSKGMVEVTIGDTVTKRMKNLYYPDGHEIKEPLSS